MKDYEAFKKEMREISEIIEKFPSEVRSRALDILVAQYLGVEIARHPESGLEAEKNPQPRSKKESFKGNTTPPSKSKAKARESYHVDTKLNLQGDGKTQSFSKFVAEKKPASAQEFNTIAVYYIVNCIGLSSATLDQVFTCYREVNRRPPEHFKQSFIDTKNKLMSINMKSDGSVEILHKGVVIVENDLPRMKNLKRHPNG